MELPLLPRCLKSSAQYFNYTVPDRATEDVQDASIQQATQSSEALAQQELRRQGAADLYTTTLKPSEIRLIELHTTHDANTTVQCTLRTHSVYSRPRYYALSYMWGDEMHHEPLLVNGLKLNVTSNLYAFLHQFRARVVSGKCALLPIWIDALCLNQMDDVEKGQQIPLMSTIYIQAQMTIVWLRAPPQPDAQELALDCQPATNHQILDYFDEVVSHMLDDDDITSIEHDALTLLVSLGEHVLRLAEHFPGLAQWMHQLHDDTGTACVTYWAHESRDNIRLEDEKALVTLLRALIFLVTVIIRNQYWSRAWITQEYATATDITIWHEEVNLELNIFWYVARCMMALLEEHEWSQLPFMVVERLHLMRTAHETGRPVYLLQALYGSYNTTTSNKHDQLFAFVSIAFDSARFLPRPDYDRALPLLLRDVIEDNIIASRSLDIICLQGRDLQESNPLNLPSWAPDIRLIGKDWYNWKMMRYLTSQTEHDVARENVWDRHTRLRWNAGGTIEVHDLLFAGQRRHELHVEGRVVGSISFLTTHAGEDIPAQSLSVRSGYLDMTDDSIQLSLYTLMTLGYRRNAGPEARNHPKLDWTKCDWSSVFDEEVYDQRLTLDAPKAVYWLLYERSFLINDRTLIDWSRGGERGHTPVSNYHLPVNLIKLLLQGMRLMGIDGSFLGWAHPKAEVGDRVFLLKGCSLPVILRPVGENEGGRHAFTVVGEAYVDECMRGYWWERHEERSERVCLR